MSESPRDRGQGTPATAISAGISVLGIVIAATAIRSALPAHQWWGRIALGGYVASLVVTLVPKLRRWWATLTILGCGLLPLMLLVVGRSRGWHHVAQSEVDVLESGAKRLLEHLTPYRDPAEMSRADATTNYSYFPYLPAMAIPGLPRALVGRHWFTDARIWMVAFDALMMRVAWPRLQPKARQVLVALIASPLVTLPATGGGHDLLVASSLVAGYVGVTAGLAAASSFTILGWPLALPALCVARIDLRRAAVVGGVVALSCVPLLVDPGAAWANIVDFPGGQTPARSPADAPSLGRLLRALPGGNVWVLLLMATIGAAFVVSLLRYPPRSPATAAGRAAATFLALIVAVPSTRAGYLIHPATLGALAWGEPTGRTDEGQPAYGSVGA